MKEKLTRFIKEESGQGMVEYGLIIAGIALVVLVAVFAFGPKISDMIRAIEEQLTIAG